MDKEKELDRSIKIIKKAKTIKINAKEAIADSNSIQLPCISEYNGERITFLEYIWNQKQNGKLIKRGIKVSGHGLLGVPTLRESDTLLALQRIYIRKKTNEAGIVELKTDDVTEEDLTINFSISELAAEIGYESPNNIGKNVRESLKNSIQILVATTVFNLYEGGLYDVRKGDYIRSDAAFHFLESCEGYEDRAGNNFVDVTKIKISRFFYDTIVNNYKLFYNTELYKKTNNKMARKIYLLALQWRGNKDYTVILMDTLIQRVPMVQEKKKYQKQYIKRALNILNEKGIVKIEYDKENSDKIWFWFKEKSNENEKYFLNEYTNYPSVLNAFGNYGFNPQEISKYLDIERLKHIQALLRYVKTRMLYSNEINAKNMIMAYIDNKYEIDIKYYPEPELS